MHLPVAREARPGMHDYLGPAHTPAGQGRGVDVIPIPVPPRAVAHPAAVPVNNAHRYAPASRIQDSNPLVRPERGGTPVRKSDESAAPSGRFFARDAASPAGRTTPKSGGSGASRFSPAAGLRVLKAAWRRKERNHEHGTTPSSSSSSSSRREKRRDGLPPAGRSDGGKEDALAWVAANHAGNNKTRSYTERNDSGLGRSDSSRSSGEWIIEAEEEKRRRARMQQQQQRREGPRFGAGFEVSPNAARSGGGGYTRAPSGVIGQGRPGGSASDPRLRSREKLADDLGKKAPADSLAQRLPMLTRHHDDYDGVDADERRRDTAMTTFEELIAHGKVGGAVAPPLPPLPGKPDDYQHQQQQQQQHRDPLVPNFSRKPSDPRKPAGKSHHHHHYHFPQLSSAGGHHHKKTSGSNTTTSSGGRHSGSTTTGSAAHSRSISKNISGSASSSAGTSAAPHGHTGSGSASHPFGKSSLFNRLTGGSGGAADRPTSMDSELSFACRGDVSPRMFAVPANGQQAQGQGKQPPSSSSPPPREQTKYCVNCGGSSVAFPALGLCHPCKALGDSLRRAQPANVRPAASPQSQPPPLLSPRPVRPAPAPVLNTRTPPPPLPPQIPEAKPRERVLARPAGVRRSQTFSGGDMNPAMNNRDSRPLTPIPFDLSSLAFVPPPPPIPASPDEHKRRNPRVSSIYSAHPCRKSVVRRASFGDMGNPYDVREVGAAAAAAAAEEEAAWLQWERETDDVAPRLRKFSFEAEDAVTVQEKQRMAGMGGIDAVVVGEWQRRNPAPPLAPGKVPIGGAQDRYGDPNGRMKMSWWRDEWETKYGGGKKKSETRVDGKGKGKALDPRNTEFYGFYDEILRSEGGARS